MCLYGSSQGDQSKHCLKCPATVQLLELGLFPCMPVWPGLAVSLVMLEWACTLFLHMASNVQAWADTVEIMLKCQGYLFRKSHSFCHRFNNALVHYQMLIRLVEAEMTQMTNGVHPLASSDEAATGTTAAGITLTLDELTPMMLTSTAMLTTHQTLWCRWGETQSHAQSTQPIQTLPILN